MNAAVLLKQARDNLSEPLTMIWTKLLETQDIPELFKMAFIKPVLQPGAPKCDASSYRPVSLASQLIKTCKRIVKKALQNHLEVTLTFNDQQHGLDQKGAASVNS